MSEDPVIVLGCVIPRVGILRWELPVSRGDIRVSQAPPLVPSRYSARLSAQTSDTEHYVLAQAGDTPQEAATKLSALIERLSDVFASLAGPGDEP